MSDKSPLRFAFIMRGVPGSGKTTFTAIISNAYKMLGHDVEVHAVDDLHTQDGIFWWDEDLEEERYEQNYLNFCKSVDNDVSFIFCDAINLQKRDYNKYIEYAQAKDYFVATVCPPLPAADVATKRNKHDVTKEQIDEMINRWEP